MISAADLLARLSLALDARAPLLAEPHLDALRLFNGFYEGCPELVVDVYARTLLLFNYADPPDGLDGLLAQVQALLLKQLPWVESVLLKTRAAADPAARCGVITYGGKPARKVRENGVWYALDLAMNQDASLYLDTRLLRGWLKDHAARWNVLNTFAYTGSLGAAALAGGAARVVQADLNRRFLNLAKDTYSLNGFPIHKADFIAADFFKLAAGLRRSDEPFDCVILDPPFFSSTSGGRVDQLSESARLINKVRPLIKDGGLLVAVNNALFVSGADYLHALEELGTGGYLTLEERISIPTDITGFPNTRLNPPPTDPAPWNHPTKIALLRVKKK